MVYFKMLNILININDKVQYYFYYSTEMHHDYNKTKTTHLVVCEYYYVQIHKGILLLFRSITKYIRCKCLRLQNRHFIQSKFFANYLPDMSLI